jgi:EAL domain-containing protein (putative c-di-GMP-specific phosphodiesterase class I)
LADSLGLSVLAEGVESSAQKEYLDRLGCHAYQGFLFSEPLVLSQFEALASQPRGHSLVRPV